MASIQPIAGALTQQQAAHLLRRTTFGPTKDEIDQFIGLNITSALVFLTQPSTTPTPPVDPATGASWLPVAGENNSGEDDLSKVVTAWWVDQMRTKGLSLTEKMVFYYHTHFTTISSVVRSSSALYYQNQLFRHYALGNYKEFALQVCLDNAMLIFLDGRENVVGKPQENFAREFLELFTIGKGPQIGDGDYTNYTEQDVQAAAKVLSGYENDKDFVLLDPITNLPKGKLKGNTTIASQHDASTKTFSEKFQNKTIAPTVVTNEQTTKEEALAELSAMVDMIFEQEETSKFICRKLYRFFMYYEITAEIENDIITPMANTLKANNFEILPAIEQLLKSEHFFDLDNSLKEDDLKGAIIKSPLEITIGTLRFFDVTFPDATTAPQEFYSNIYNEILDTLTEQGLELYEPYEVAGYPAYHQNPDFNRNWISANYLGNRYFFINELLNGIGNTNDYSETIQLDALRFVETHIPFPANAQSIVETFVNYLLPEIITSERFDYFLDFVLLDDLSPVNWANEWNAYKSSGDDMAVRQQLNKLCIAIMQSPEYQLH